MKEKPLFKRKLYEQVTDRLREEIAALPAGTRLEAEPQLAARFAVSGITVRAALKILHTEGLLERIQGKGTFVRERTKPTGRIALLIDQDVFSPQTSPVYLGVANHLRRLLRRRGVNSQFYIGGNAPNEPKDSVRCPEFLEDLEKGQLSGVAAVLAMHHSEWMTLAERQNLPVVGYGVNYRYCVRYDSAAFIETAVAGLVAKGRRRLGVLCWQGLRNHAKVIAAFEAACVKHGVETCPEWQVVSNPNMVGAGWEAFRELWISRERRPDGVIVTDDLLFAGVVTAVNEMGVSIPGDLDVAALVNHEAEVLHSFPATHYEFSPALVAQEMDRLLQAKMADPALPPQRVLLQVRPVERASLANTVRKWAELPPPTLLSAWPDA